MFKTKPKIRGVAPPRRCWLVSGYTVVQLKVGSQAAVGLSKISDLSPSICTFKIKKATLDSSN